MRWLFAGPLAILAGVCVGLIARQSGATQAFFAENGPVETLQALILAIVAAAFFLAFLRSSDSRALFCITGATAAAIAMTREVPRCGSTFFDGGVCMTGDGKTVAVSLALSAGATALWFAPIAWRRAIAIRNIAWVWPVAVVVVMLALADIAEAKVYMEIEEALELTAYAYLSTFGVWVLFHTRKLRPATLSERRGCRWPAE
ncbi:MAG: hypothetical protein H7Y08_10895 [Rhizobiaceae bacterium]|nr:hypothetical protein [Rhizobiaceae bacterium]